MPIPLEEAERLSSVNWGLLDKYPYRVVVSFLDKDYITEVRRWLVERHGGIGIDRPVCGVLAGNYIVYGFKDKAEAAMFHLLFFEAA